MSLKQWIYDVIYTLYNRQKKTIFNNNASSSILKMIKGCKFRMRIRLM